MKGHAICRNSSAGSSSVLLLKFVLPDSWLKGAPELTMEKGPPNSHRERGGKTSKKREYKILYKVFLFLEYLDYRDHLLYVVGNGYCRELCAGQLAPSIVEASEAAVILELPEDGLRLDWAHASVIQAPLAC